MEIMVRDTNFLIQESYFMLEHHRETGVTKTRKNDRELAKCFSVTKSFSIFPHCLSSPNWTPFMQSLKTQKTKYNKETKLGGKKQKEANRKEDARQKF